MVIRYDQAPRNRVPPDRLAGNGRQSSAVSFQHIGETLVACGYTSLDEQAKVLGLHRSTTWTIVKAKHKLGRLSAKTSRRILANPALPAPVRNVVQQYLAERPGNAR